MKSFPITVRVALPDKITADSQPQVEINPLSISSPISCTFRVDPGHSQNIGLQVATGLDLHTNTIVPMDIERLIFDVRAYLAVMDKLEARDPKDRYNFEPRCREELTGNVNRNNATTLAALVYDVFGPLTGNQQSDMLADVIGNRRKPSA